MWATDSDDKFKIATGNASSVETVALQLMEVTKSKLKFM